MTGPAAFMSYVRFDDAHEDGQLSAFRERLAGEIRIQTLASRMRDTFWQLPAVPAAPVTGSARSAGSAATRGDVTAAEGAPRQDATRSEPPARVVDAYLRGNFATVSEAIEAADPGDRILVRPGLCQEPLVVDKPLEIIGDGPVEDIEIRATGANVLEFRAGIGRVANLTLRQADGRPLGVAIFQGRLDLEGCDISGRGAACVYILDGADPRLRRNKIHDGPGDGVLIDRSGLGTLEDNEITRNGGAGVAVTGAGNPVLRRNQIHGNEHYGVRVSDGGLGTFEDNEITGNRYAGVSSMLDSNPTVRGNRINRNGAVGLNIFDGGKAVVEDNDLTGNEEGAWYIDDDCEPNVTRARNKE